MTLTSDNLKPTTTNNQEPTTNNQQPFKMERYYKLLITVISVAVFGIVAVLSQLPKAESIPSWAAVLPALNAFLNATTTIVLLVSFYFIRRKNVEIHKRLNLLACGLSTIFLLSYVTFHAFGVETRFPADNPLRPLYLVILSSHILLAAIVLPLVLLSLYRGLTMQTALHRKIVRWSFPVWLYVTVTGVVVYLMISPYYRF
jgi:putative membrane protein